MAARALHPAWGVQLGEEADDHAPSLTRALPEGKCLPKG